MARSSEKISAEEIKVTPEMIDAGARELRRFDRDYEDEKAAVKRIYIAMYYVSSKVK